MSKVNIRPANRNDISALHRIKTMPGVYETSSNNQAERLEETELWYDSLSKRDILFVAEVDNNVVGYSMLDMSDNPRYRHFASVHFSVDANFQGMGIGTELATHIVNFADNFLSMPRLELMVMAANKGAIHLYEKVGFVHEGTMRKADLWGGIYTDILVMGRLHPVLFPNG